MSPRRQRSSERRSEGEPWGFVSDRVRAKRTGRLPVLLGYVMRRILISRNDTHEESSDNKSETKNR